MNKIDNSQNITIKDSEKVKVGDITHQVTVNPPDGILTEIEDLFDTLQKRVSTLPEGPGKNVVRGCIEGLYEEANKGKDAQKGNVKKWLNFLLEISPDIWAVAVESFLHPVRGLSTVFQKVAERAKRIKGY